MQELSRDQRETLWSQLASLLDRVLLEFPPERWDAGRGEEDREEGMVVEVSPDMEQLNVSQLALIGTLSTHTHFYVDILTMLTCTQYSRNYVISQLRS